jgi:hypothetical protein
MEEGMKAVFKTGKQTIWDMGKDYQIGDKITKTVGEWYFKEDNKLTFVIEEYDEFTITDKEVIDQSFKDRTMIQHKFYLSNGEQQSIYEF